MKPTVADSLNICEGSMHCICDCRCRHMRVYSWCMCLIMLVCGGVLRPNNDIRCFHTTQSPSTLIFWESISHGISRTYIWLGRLANEFQKSHCFCSITLSALGFPVLLTITCGFYVKSGDQKSDLHSMKKPFYWQRHLPSSGRTLSYLSR